MGSQIFIEQFPALHYNLEDGKIFISFGKGNKREVIQISQSVSYLEVLLAVILDKLMWFSFLEPRILVKQNR